MWRPVRRKWGWAGMGAMPGALRRKGGNSQRAARVRAAMGRRKRRTGFMRGGYGGGVKKSP
jgi:hypothetical protein